MTDKWIIRTHDRIAFKHCRQAWDYGSKIRQNWEANVVPDYFEFGSAIHAGQEVYYNPQTWDLPIKGELALCAFVDYWDKFKDVYFNYAEQRVLGLEMLKNYFNWSKTNDAGLKPIACELEFELPIHVPDGFKLTSDFSYTNDGYMLYCGKLVYYQGRIDNVLQDSQGNLWLKDTKTAARLEDAIPFLELDEQIGSYLWAMREMGRPCKGLFYDQLQKSYPVKPELIRNGKALSKAKALNTTYELYVEAIEENHFSIHDYTDHLEWLKFNPSQSIRRTRATRSNRELDALGDQIALEAIDMLNNPSIYPNPTGGWSGCDRCQFRTPCLASRDGSGAKFYLKEQFHIRDSV